MKVYDSIDMNSLIEQYVALTSNIIDYNKFNQYSLTHHSTHIEGSTLTYDEVVELLDNGMTPAGKPLLHSLMAADHINALRFVLELAEQKQKLTVDIVKEISAMVMKSSGSKISMLGGDFDSSKGEFRKGAVRVGNRSFKDYNKVPELIKELVTYVNTNIEGQMSFEENSLLAFDTHFQFVSIHPFADGNGRVSRLLMNFVQHYHGQPITPVLKEDKADYFKALEETRDKKNIEIFRKFMFGQSIKFFQKEIGLINREQIQQPPRDKGISFLF